MLQAALDWLAAHSFSSPLVVIVLAVAALAATRVSRIIVRRTIRHLANAAARSTRPQQGWWRVRTRRAEDETRETGEQRRRQRIEAASRMVNHLVSLLIWIVAVIVAFHLLDVDPAFFLSSAGFLGAGLAIGGQHKVNDYLTGLSVHFEDRYGVGDEIVADVGWDQPVHAVVDHVGLFSTRLRDQRSTLHFPNSALAIVRNVSQEACTETLRLRVPEVADAHDAASVLRGLAGSEGLTDVVFVGDLEPRAVHTGELEIDVVTSRALDPERRERLVDRAEQTLLGRGGT